jgi:magnesium-protoporphyrin IX monomethyl ester (oxidative) cyclase
MNILLLETSRTYSERSKGVRLSLPLGPLYLAAVLEGEGHGVSILDCKIAKKTRIKEISKNEVHHGLDNDDFKSLIKKEDPDIVGVSAMFTAQFDNYLEATKLIKQVNSDILVVGGGPHFSVIDSDFLLTNRDTDCYVSGEGEYPFLEIVKAKIAGKSLVGIKGVTTIERSTNGEKSKITSTDNELNRELDTLPLPAYNKIDMDMFFDYQLNGCKGYKGPLSARLDQGGKKTVSMITSRGCPYKCTFCSIALHMGKPVRAHSGKYVVDHIEYLVNNYGVEHIFFEDDNLTFRMDRTREYCEAILDRGINFEWTTPNGVRADKLDLELLKLMKKAGCKGLIVGTESGDQDTLTNIIKKDLNIDTVIQVAKWCKELDIPLTQFLIIGFPGETKEKMQRTINFAAEMYDKYRVKPLLNIATPLIGTELYNVVVEGQLLVQDATPHALAGATQPIIGSGMIKTDEFTPEDLNGFARQLDSLIQEINSDYDITYHV